MGFRSTLLGQPRAFPSWPAGYDPNHPAARGARAKGNIASVVAASGKQVQFRNLFTGAKATVVSVTGPTATIDPRIGPVVNTHSTDTAAEWSVPAASSGTPTQWTFGAILTTTGTQVTNGAVIGQESSNFLGFDSTNHVLLAASSTTFTSSITIASGSTVFIGASCTTTAQNLVVVNLLNGSILTATGTTAMTFAAQAGIFFLVATAGTPSGGNFNLAAAMVNAGALLSMPELIKWGTDPWAFWYPRTEFQTMNWLGPPAAGFPIGVPMFMV